MRVSDTPTIAAIEVKVAEENKKFVQSAFFAERESFQEDVKAQAKKLNADKFDVYASILFTQRLNDRYGYAMSKREKVLTSALSVLVAAGMSEADARKRLGLGE